LSLHVKLAQWTSLRENLVGFLIETTYSGLLKTFKATPICPIGVPSVVPIGIICFKCSTVCKFFLKIIGNFISQVWYFSFVISFIFYFCIAGIGENRFESW